MESDIRLGPRRETKEEMIERTKRVAEIIIAATNKLEDHEAPPVSPTRKKGIYIGAPACSRA